MNIFLGLIGIIISYLIIRYRHQVVGFTGSWGWAEKYIGSGHSETACTLLGVLTFFISVTIASGKGQDILLGILGPILGR